MYGFSDGEETMEDEHYPQSLFVCDDMEVVGNVDEDGEVEVDMFEKGEDVVVEDVRRVEEGNCCDDRVKRGEEGDDESTGEDDSDDEVRSGEEEDGGTTGEDNSDDEGEDERTGEDDSDDEVRRGKEEDCGTTGEDDSDDDRVTRPQHKV